MGGDDQPSHNSKSNESQPKSDTAQQHLKKITTHIISKLNSAIKNIREAKTSYENHLTSAYNILSKRSETNLDDAESQSIGVHKSHSRK